MSGTPRDRHDIGEDRRPADRRPSRAPLPAAWWDLTLVQRRRIAAVVAFGVVVAGVLGVSALSGGDAGEPDPELFVAALPNERVALWDELAACESESQWDLDTGNGYFGGLQFHPESWRGVDGEGSPADASRAEQIMRAEMLFDLQGFDAWPRCSTTLGLD